MAAKSGKKRATVWFDTVVELPNKFKKVSPVFTKRQRLGAVTVQA